MGRRHRWLSWAVLLVATGGLLLMHGVEPGTHGQIHGAASEHQTAAAHGGHAMSATLAQLHAPVDVATATPGQQPSGDGHAHLAMLCTAVLVGAALLVLRRLLPSRQAVVAALPVAADRWRARLVDTFRPPGPGRVALCVQLC